MKIELLSVAKSGRVWEEFVLDRGAFAVARHQTVRLDFKIVPLSRLEPLHPESGIANRVVCVGWLDIDGISQGISGIVPGELDAVVFVIFELNVDWRQWKRFEARFRLGSRFCAFVDRADLDLMGSTRAEAVQLVAIGAVVILVGVLLRMSMHSQHFRATVAIARLPRDLQK